MRWDDIKWEREIWTIPAPKNGVSYDVALLPAALEILKARRKMAAQGVVYVFPGKGGTGHLIDLREPWCAFRERCGLLDITFHDLRRTNGSYQALAGVPLQQIGKNLGHVGIGSTEIYARLHTQALRAARQSGDKTMRQLMQKANKRLSA
jgi:integrase